MFWIFRSHVSSNAAFLFKLISTFELHIKDGFLHVKVHLQWKIQLDDTRNLSSLDLYDWLELFFSIVSVLSSCLHIKIEI